MQCYLFMLIGLSLAKVHLSLFHLSISITCQLLGGGSCKREAFSLLAADALLSATLPVSKHFYNSCLLGPGMCFFFIISAEF